MMKIVVFIPARIGSTRLNNKPLLKIKGKPVIEHLIERVKSARLPDFIVLCTTKNPDDMILVDIAKKEKIKCFRGSEKDILKRYLDAAEKYNVDFIVNVDGDDILCEPEFIDKTIRAFMKTGVDFIRWVNAPLGAVPCGIKVSALKKICKMKAETNTETGWGRYFTETGIFKIKTIKVSKELMFDARMTLDYPEDFRFFKEIFNKLYKQNKNFSLKDILILLKKEPELMNINKYLNEKYWKNFEKKAVKAKIKRSL